MAEQTILIAEDDPDIRDGVRILLSGEGYHIIEAENGTRALEVFRPEVDLVILDNTAIMVVTAAKDMNRKNRKPHNLPPDMALNTFGSVTNTRPGPLSAATLKEKQEGNIIRPAIKATQVSRMQTLRLSPSKERSFPI